MTKDEFKILAKAMKAVYTDARFLPDKDAFDVWYEMIKDIPYPIASEAVKYHISNSPYNPTVSDIRKYATMRTEGNSLNGEQAWSLVFRAIENSNYNSQEEFDKLPPLVQKAVGSPINLKELAQMPTDTVNSVEKSHFLRTYAEESKREKEFNNMPPNMRRLTDQSSKMLEG